MMFSGSRDLFEFLELSGNILLTMQDRDAGALED